MEFSLLPHPDFPSRAIHAISVDVRRENDFLELTNRRVGAIDEIAWPAPGNGGWADGLWQHSCLEAFIGRTDEPDYTEINLATSGQWAAYQFDGYRRGMVPIDDISFALSMTFGPERMKFWAATHLPVLETGRGWRLGLSAIIEARDGTKSYWALAHPPGKPDFHDVDCFTARLAAPDRA